MEPWYAVLLFVAGVGGGLAGSIAGLASLTMYPALLMVGLPPVAANMTNTVAFVFNGIGSVLGSKPELRGQSAALKILVPTGVVGGAAGAVLLLHISPQHFQDVLPVILALSAVLLLLPRRDRPQEAQRRRAFTVLKGAAVLAIFVYGGFFGAAAGVLLLALFLGMGSESLAHANAMKNAGMAAVNCGAALIFIAFATVHWVAAVPLSLGCLLGSRLAPVIVRRAPATPLRLLIAAAGMALAVKLGVDTYR